MDDPDIKLINLVKLFPHLYNRRDTNFKNKVMIEQSWRKIAGSMNTNWEDCQRRWGVLRNRYAKEKRENGTEWMYFAYLTFLDVHVKTRRSFKSLYESARTETFSEDYSPPKIPKWEEVTIDEGKLDDNDVKQIDNTYVYQSDSSCSVTFTSAHEPVSESRNPDTSRNSSCEATSKKLSTSETSSSAEDSNMHFCLSLYEPLKNVPKHVLTKAKIEILRVLDKYENA